MPVIDFANLNDIPDLAALLALLFDQEADFKPDAAKQATGLRAILEDPNIGTILVLRKGQKAIGMVSLLYTISTALGGKVAILEDMVLQPDHRGKGHGTTLLQAAIATAKAQGCKRITLLTDLSNEAAIQFYQRQGFVQSAMTPLRLLLSD